MPFYVHSRVQDALCLEFNVFQNNMLKKFSPAARNIFQIKNLILCDQDLLYKRKRKKPYFFLKSVFAICKNNVNRKETGLPLM